MYQAHLRGPPELCLIYVSQEKRLGWEGKHWIYLGHFYFSLHSALGFGLLQFIQCFKTCKAYSHLLPHLVSWTTRGFRWGQYLFLTPREDVNFIGAEFLPQVLQVGSLWALHSVPFSLLHDLSLSILLSLRSLRMRKMNQWRKHRIKEPQVRFSGNQLEFVHVISERLVGKEEPWTGNLNS